MAQSDYLEEFGSRTFKLLWSLLLTQVAGVFAGKRWMAG
jgi:hypothetical protein